MRDPSDVIDQILEIIPREELVLRAELEQIQLDAWFYPPEGKYPAWAALRHTLTARFPEKPPEGWPMRVSNIVRGVSD